MWTCKGNWFFGRNKIRRVRWELFGFVLFHENSEIPSENFHLINFSLTRTRFPSPLGWAGKGDTLYKRRERFPLISADDTSRVGTTHLQTSIIMGAATDRRKDLLVRLISSSPSFPGRTDLIYTKALTGNPHPFLKKHFHPADTLPERRSWRGKMGTGISLIVDCENGIYSLGLGFSHWEWDEQL